VTRTIVGAGVTQADLDGTPSGTAPTIVYPLDGALFPYELGPLVFQVVPTSSAQTEARVAFKGSLIDLNVYEPCVPIADPTIPNACEITIPSSVEAQLDYASGGATLTETIRLAAPGGGSLAETMPISVRWSAAQLHGALYYWSANPSTGSSVIMRYNLDTPGAAPQQYFSQFDEPAMDPPYSNGYGQCFGCHAISLDGAKMGLTFGSSTTENFALFDIATKKTIATRLFPSDPNTGTQPFAAFTTFSPDGTVMLQSVGGKLTLRTADASLTTISANVFASTIKESATTPFWSAKGDLVAFTGWLPDTANTSGTDLLNTNGDETLATDIWIAAATDDRTFATPTVLVPKDPSGMRTEHYPAISHDSKWVVFNESSCSGPAAPAGETSYGASPCDGYDDPSAMLRMVSAGGGTPVDLGKASQNDNWSNSWPRFAPPPPTGPAPTFQGGPLYWVVFSSRHPYGATIPGTADPASMNTPTQLWVAAVVPSATQSGDPSFAPVWIPQQNPGTMPSGNHTAQWVTKAVQ
jgi:hypothetical protein